ncbi:MAG: M48 family metallopeptidase [Flavobacteriaceae bacterium]|nr:M48 family metallopeptidase [Flavobacteriaceae bacterium]MBT4297746.1 M48 family metallopeptidase [Flavobacteriaceae bacterium]MBT4960834.1 M48 family metallopeptidase [Flavobacteriaceae bacterium]MBT6653930.1 M48 family metallopeptidase [Flavobacteriaceae bacterium]MBT7573243.1 M48 family metallopeptidase [Flavobacteriaceae bacterium]
MNPETLFNILITIIVLNFLKDSILDYLNSTFFNKEIPVILSDIYDEKKYLKSQEYKKIQYRFSRIFNIYSFLILMLFFYLDGFLIVDNFSRSLFESELVISLSFFAIIYFGNDILRIPFSLYNTFIIEEKFGFNKTSIKTFINDKLKSWLLTILFGGGIISFIIFQFESIGQKFWIVAWIFISVLTVLINGLYTQVIVPLFNKQTKLEDGELKSEIEKYSKKVGFNLSNIFVIDGSKRSTKANAYFSGFGKQKRVTLFDTLINKLNKEQIVAVIAHEIGHYKKNHIIFNLLFSIIQTGIMLYILSLLIYMPIFSEALNIENHSFHIALVTFSILYTPISEISSIIFNLFSRKFEYEADEYADKSFDGKYLIQALKVLTKDSLSNLTPHPKYVWWHYSHPTLLERINQLQ